MSKQKFLIKLRKSMKTSLVKINDLQFEIENLSTKLNIHYFCPQCGNIWAKVMNESSKGTEMKYSECQPFIQQRKAFQTFRMNGTSVGDVYMIYSYGYWPIAMFSKGEWSMNMDVYPSRTTRKHFRIVQEILGDSIKRFFIYTGK